MSSQDETQNTPKSARAPYINFRSGYNVTSSGTNNQGNYYQNRDYGPEAPNQNSYYYSNADGSYAYNNPDGSKYYNTGTGFSKYTTPRGFEVCDAGEGYAPCRSSKSQGLSRTGTSENRCEYKQSQEENRSMSEHRSQADNNAGCDVKQESANGEEWMVARFYGEIVMGRSVNAKTGTQAKR